MIETGYGVRYPSITSRKYNGLQNGVFVSTRVPSNRFDFVDGNIITVSGRILTALQRRLKAAAEGAGRALQTADEGGAFRLDLTLVDPNQPQVGGKPIKEPTILGKSAATASQGIIVMGVIFAVAFALFL